MAAMFTYACTQCNFKVTTISGFKFYRDSDGNVEVFDHPGDGYVDFKGWIDRLFCSYCGDVRLAIIEEFEEPVPSWVWNAWFDEQHKKIGIDKWNSIFDYRSKPVCLECGSESVSEQPCGEQCPKCRAGVLEFYDMGIS